MFIISSRWTAFLPGAHLVQAHRSLSISPERLLAQGVQQVGPDLPPSRLLPRLGLESGSTAPRPWEAGVRRPTMLGKQAREVGSPGQGPLLGRQRTPEEGRCGRALVPRPEEREVV